MRRIVLIALFCAAGLPLVAASQQKPLVTQKDLAKWEGLGPSRLSADGAWLAWSISRGNEENELRLRGGPRDSTSVIPFGQSAAFSPDSRWLGYLIGVSPKERDRLTKEKKPVHNSFAVRNLATGETIAVPEASAFAFNPSGGFLAVTRYPAEGKKVSEVLVFDLGKGTRLSFGNVLELAWSDARPLLALSVAPEGGAGNAVQVYDGASGAVHVLDASPSLYRSLSWRPKHDGLAVLRTVTDKSFADTAHTILLWESVGVEETAPKSLDPVTAPGFPAGVRIADSRRPGWSHDGRILYFGVRPRVPARDSSKKSDEKLSDVEIWHSNDVHAIPEQRANEQRDLRNALLLAWHLAGGPARLVTLGSDLAETTTVLEGDRFALETDRKAYAFGQKFGRPYDDLWTVDIGSGARRKLLDKVRFGFAGDPTGRRIAWFDGRDYLVVDVAAGARTNLTAALRAKGADFVNRDDDHPTDIPSPWGAATWSKDGNTLIVATEYDLWALALDGSGGRRLTDGVRQGVVSRLVSFAGFSAPPAERAVDLTRPVYLSLYGKRTKQSGYARLAPSGAVQRLILADASIGSLSKADSAERYAWVRQRFDESPNLYLGGAELSDARRWSETNPFQNDYAWGKAELLNFSSTIGRPLQGILYYPANYDATKKYPMIVYTYELLSQGYHRYIVPRENDYYNATVFTQNGYFVLMPDIVFRPREPGLAVLQAVEPAVKSVIARGLVDPARIGHCGHSQGGYEAYFLATHSGLFKTAVAGAGITDMISFAGQMHWNSVPEFDHWETGQFRMQVAPWEDMPAMVANSPLARVQVMPAQSILMEIGGDDGVVDMRQGVEFWNYARRAGKNAVMLLYPGEGHGLGKRENAIDYERRILQWFGYYLKGDPPAKWITDGQSWLDRKAALDANK